MRKKTKTIQLTEKEACIYVESLGQAIPIITDKYGPNRVSLDLLKLKTKLEEGISDDVWQEYLHKN